MAIAGLLATLTACGEDEDSGSEPAPVEESGPAALAEEIAACTEEAGLTPSITETSSGVVAIDLTTETETILVHILDSEEEAAGYENGAGLDQEQIGQAVLIGGAIKPANREAIRSCIENAA
jgi:hypothetical protein